MITVPQNVLYVVFVVTLVWGGWVAAKWYRPSRGALAELAMLAVAFAPMVALLVVYWLGVVKGR